MRRFEMVAAAAVGLNWAWHVEQFSTSETDLRWLAPAGLQRPVQQLLNHTKADRLLAFFAAAAAVAVSAALERIT